MTYTTSIYTSSFCGVQYARCVKPPTPEDATKWQYVTLWDGNALVSKVQLCLKCLWTASLSIFDIYCCRKMHVQSLTFLLCVHLNSECKSFVIKSYSRMQTYVIIKTETWIKEIKGFITKCLWDKNCYSVLSIHFCFYDFDPLFLSVLACSICLRVLRAVPTVTSPASEQMSNDDMWKNVVMWTCVTEI